MLPRLLKIQLVLLTGISVVAVVVLGWYYLRIPALWVLVGTRCMPICRNPAGFTEPPTSHTGA